MVFGARRGPLTDSNVAHALGSASSCWHSDVELPGHLASWGTQMGALAVVIPACKQQPDV